MRFQVETTPRFERELRRFLKKHPQLRERVDRVFQDLEQDPWQPHLRLHALSGHLEGLHAVRVDFSNRVVLTLRVSEQEIVLVDIGSHDEVYR